MNATTLQFSRFFQEGVEHVLNTAAALQGTGARRRGESRLEIICGTARKQDGTRKRQQETTVRCRCEAGW